METMDFPEVLLLYKIQNEMQKQMDAEKGIL